MSTQFISFRMTEQLFAKYGPLLTLQQLAEILSRTYDGLRMALRDQSDFSDKVNAARVRLGRRVYFKTEIIAQILGGE